MNNRLIILMVALLGILMPSLAYASGCGAIPSGLSLTYCLQINIQNTQTSPFVANTQIPIYFTANAYSTYLASNIMNVFVYNDVSGNAAPCWLEGNTLAQTGSATILSASANDLYWCKIPDAVPSSTTDSNWYFGIAPTTTDLFGNSIAQVGIAPQLDGGTTSSGNYGNVDNGNVVFNFYDNYSGTTLHNKWVVTAGTVSVSSGLTMTAGASTPTIVSNAMFNPETNTLDSLSYFNAHDTGFSFMTTWAKEATFASIAHYIGIRSDTDYSLYQANGGSSGVVQTTTSDTSVLHVFSVYGSATTGYLGVDYGQLVSTATDYPALTTANVFMTADNGGESIFVQWIRVRASPPNNVQATVSYGTLTGAGSVLTINPNPAVYGQFISITSTPSPLTDGSNVIFNGNEVNETSNIGEAPYLSSTYGKYDNGNQIFIYYCRFGGLSALPNCAGNTWQQTVGSTVAFTANALTVVSGTAATNNGIYVTTPYSTNTPFNAIDVLVNYSAGTHLTQIAVTNSIVKVGAGGAYWDIQRAPPSTQFAFSTNNLQTPLTPNVFAISNTLMETASLTGAATANVYMNYSLESPSFLAANQFDQMTGANILYFGTQEAVVPQSIFMIDTRTEPKNDVMPSVTEGAESSSCGNVGILIITTGCIPLTITNLVAVAQPANLQVVFTFPANQYTTYLNGNVQNIYIYNSVSGQTVATFIEGNTMNWIQDTSMNTIGSLAIIIKLPDALGASATDSNLKIGIGSMNTNFMAQQTGVTTYTVCSSPATMQNCLAASGSYTFIGCDTTTSTCSSSTVLSINANTALVTLPSFPSPNAITYNGNPQTFTGNIITLGNQVTANMFINGVIGVVGGFFSQGTNTIKGGAATYTVVANTLGNGNYLSNTITNTLVISQATPTANFIVNGYPLGSGHNIFANTQYPVNIAAMSNIQPANPLVWNVDYYLVNGGRQNEFYSGTGANNGLYQNPIVSNIIWYLQTNGNTNYTAVNGFLTSNIALNQMNILFTLEYGNTIYGANDLIQVQSAPQDYITISLSKGGSSSLVASGNSILTYDLQNWFTTGTYTITANDLTLGASATANVLILPPLIYACSSYQTNIGGHALTPYNTIVQNNQISIVNQTIKEINLFDTTGNPLAFSTTSNDIGYLNYTIQDAQGQIVTANSLGTMVGFTSATYWSGSELLLCQINSNNNKNPILTGGLLQYTTANGVTSYQTFANEQLSPSPLTVDNFYSPYQPNSAKFSVFVLQYGLNQIQAKVQIFLVSPSGAVTLVDFLNTPQIAGTIVSLPNNFTYLFNIYSTNNKLLSIVNQTPLYCPAGQICNLALPTQQNINYSTEFSISSACSYTQSSNTIVCSVDDPTTLTKNFYLTVNETDQLSNPVVCNNTVASYYGVVSCTGINANLHRYSYKLYGSYAGVAFLLRSGGEGNTSTNQFGEAGLYASLFIILVIGLLGVYDPIFLIFGDILALMLINWLGFLVLNIVILAQFIIVGIAYIYRIKF